MSAAFHVPAIHTLLGGLAPREFLTRYWQKRPLLVRGAWPGLRDPASVSDLFQLAARDDCLTHAEFRDENGISLTLLADPDGDVCRAYGVWRDPEENGLRRSCIVRSTFVIDKRGKLRHALYGVNPKGHASEVLGLVKQLT